MMRVTASVCTLLIYAISFPLAASHATTVEPLPSNETGLVHTYFLLDRSGSMRPIAKDMIGAFNSYLDEQRHQTNAHGMRFTLVQFDTNQPFEVLWDGVPMNKAAELSADVFRPRGGTPLYDAMGSMIEHIEQREEKMPDTEREAVVLVVLTDGEENSSRRFKREEVFNRLQQKREKRGWTTVFLGANQDSYEAGGDLGVSAGNTQNFAFDGQGVELAMRSLSKSTTSLRQAASLKSVMQEGGDAEFFKSEEAEADYQARTHGTGGSWNSEEI